MLIYAEFTSFALRTHVCVDVHNHDGSDLLPVVHNGLCFNIVERRLTTISLGRRVIAAATTTPAEVEISFTNHNVRVGVQNTN